MRKWIVAVVIIICLAVIGIFYKPYDSQTVVLQLPYKVIEVDKAYTYTNPSGFSFEIPEKWVNKAEIIEDGNTITFNATIIPDNKLRFFQIIVLTHKEYQKNKKEYDPLGYVGENDNYVFIYAFHLSVNYRSQEESDRYSEEFIELNDSFPDKVKRITIHPADNGQ